MVSRRNSEVSTWIKVIVGALVGIGCGVAVRTLTDWPWWVRYPLILVAVFVAALILEAIRDARARRTRVDS